MNTKVEVITDGVSARFYLTGPCVINQQSRHFTLPLPTGDHKISVGISDGTFMFINSIGYIHVVVKGAGTITHEGTHVTIENEEIFWIIAK